MKSSQVLIHLGILPLGGVSRDGSDLRGASEEDLNILLTLYFPASRHWQWKWVNTSRLGSGGFARGVCLDQGCPSRAKAELLVR